MPLVHTLAKVPLNKLPICWSKTNVPKNSRKYLFLRGFTKVQFWYLGEAGQLYIVKGICRNSTNLKRIDDAANNYFWLLSLKHWGYGGAYMLDFILFVSLANS